jgi:CBS domain-containing protein
MRVHDVLIHKGSAVATIAPGATVAEALDSLDKNGIGALVVTSDGKTIEGIISERDIVRALNVRRADLLGMAVREVMRADVPTCVPSVPAPAGGGRWCHLRNREHRRRRQESCRRT